MNEIEQNVWRSVRALTTLTVLVVLLLIAGSIANTFDLSLTGGWGRGATRAPLLQEPTGPGIRVQSYAEIIPGAQNTAHAWALGPDQQGNMSSNTIANEQQVSAAAQSVWPAAPPLRTAQPLTITARAAFDKAEPLSSLPSPSPAAVMSQTTFVVQQPLANLRSGPSTDYPILGITHAGNRHPITARVGDWWQITANGAAVWIHSALGVIEGDIGAVPVISPLPAAPTAVLVGAVAVQPTATPTRLPTYAYSVETTRHPESNTVVIYALIQDNQAIVGDLFLSVEHNGQRWRSEPSSYAVQGVTKPSDPGSPYNRTYNAKIDFPRFLFPVLDTTGDWAITLVDGLGQPLSVISTITIAPDDPQREIYLYYRKIKL